jgi:UDPglucose 6-dehydrogenase
MSASPRITVLGLWHLGCVTAACCAKHFNVIGLDFDERRIADLKSGKPPIFEPGLDELIRTALETGQLRFTANAVEACADADVLWLCHDTPVDENDESNVAFVLEELRRCLAHLPNGKLVLVSSQLPVGTCRVLELEFPQFDFACSPENLRLGKAIATFEKPDRIIVGLRNNARRSLSQELFKPFTSQVLFMRTESAEMVKHALNSFLALSITFINEIARLCEQVGADAQEVSAGLKSDARIGPRAYLAPGGPFAGGTLARDLVALARLADRERETLFLLPAIKSSNDEHHSWALRKLQSCLGDLRGKTIAVLGLVYTPNTDTLRRSAAVELCQRLVAAGAHVRTFDPAVKTLPPELSSIALVTGLAAALDRADATVVCTEWPLFRESRWAELVQTMHQPAVIVDANGSLADRIKSLPAVEYFRVGVPAAIPGCQ